MNRPGEIDTRHSGSALVCFALPEEAAPFRQRLFGRADVAILVTGMGRGKAARAVADFLAQHSMQVGFTCGFAGGLNPEFAPGTVLFSTDADALRRKLLAAGAKPAKFLSVDHFLITADEKNTWRARTGADAVDMESDAIHAACRQRGIPCATVRVILDSASEDLPLDFNRLVKPDMSLSWVKLAWELARAPRKLRALQQVRKQGRVGAQRLGDVLAQVIGPP